MTTRTAPPLVTGFAEANGTRLYYERRGKGPPILFISGATGDAGHYTRVSELLADEATVVTYDRRANSRSPRPAGWTRTSIEEQAEDAALLLEALHLAPATVFGSSGGAAITLELVRRHPGLVRGAIVHEPPLLSVLENPGEPIAVLEDITHRGLEAGGPRAAMELFLRWAAGDDNFERLEAGLRERMLANADVFFSVELEAFGSYAADTVALRASGIPVRVMAGVESAGLFYYEAAEWLVAQLGTSLQELPGAHVPYLDHVEETAAAISAFARDLR